MSHRLAPLWPGSPAPAVRRDVDELLAELARDSPPPPPPPLLPFAPPSLPVALPYVVLGVSGTTGGEHAIDDGERAAAADGVQAVDAAELRAARSFYGGARRDG